MHLHSRCQKGFSLLLHLNRLFNMFALLSRKVDILTPSLRARPHKQPLFTPAHLLVHADPGVKMGVIRFSHKYHLYVFSVYHYYLYWHHLRTTAGKRGAPYVRANRLQVINKKLGDVVLHNVTNSVISKGVSMVECVLYSHSLQCEQLAVLWLRYTGRTWDRWESQNSNSASHAITIVHMYIPWVDALN